MRRFKVCHRCEGNVLVDKDQHGWYEQCLQCGYLRDLESVIGVARKPSWEEIVREPARPARGNGST